MRIYCALTYLSFEMSLWEDCMTGGEDGCAYSIGFLPFPLLHEYP